MSVLNYWCRTVPRQNEITGLFGKVRDADRRLYGWMRAQHDDLLVELGTERIVWRPVMRVIAELGLVDEHGKEPTRDTAFRTWLRVRRDVAASRARKQGRPAFLASGEIAPGVRALSDPHDLTSGTGMLPMARQQRVRLDIRPARALGDVPGAAIEIPDVPAITADPTAVTVAAPIEDADAQIRRVFDAISAARTPMPKLIR
jgi:hypothetical protein